MQIIQYSGGVAGGAECNGFTVLWIGKTIIEKAEKDVRCRCSVSVKSQNNERLSDCHKATKKSFSYGAIVRP